MGRARLVIVWLNVMISLAVSEMIREKKRALLYHK
jgi:hypothetical protein